MSEDTLAYFDYAHADDAQFPDRPIRDGKVAFAAVREPVALRKWQSMPHMQGHWAEYSALPRKGGHRDEFEKKKLREYEGEEEQPQCQADDDNDELPPLTAEW